MKPLFPAVVDIYDELGKTNQLVLVTELASRELRRLSEEHPGGHHGYMHEATNRHRLRVFPKDLSPASLKLADWYVAAVFHTFDQLTRRLIREIQSYKVIAPWKDKNGNQQLSPLEQLAANQPRDGARRLDHYAEFSFLEYYRKVRNEAVHARRGQSDSAIVALRKFKAKWPEYVRETYGYAIPPSPPDSMCIDDFFLFSRASRDFSLVINDAFDLHVADIVQAAKQDLPLKKAIKSCSGQEHRIQNIVRQYYCDLHLRRDDAPALRNCEAFVAQMMSERIHHPARLSNPPGKPKSPIANRR